VVMDIVKATTELAAMEKVMMFHIPQEGRHASGQEG
jgi:hypothetical protein